MDSGKKSRKVAFMPEHMEDYAEPEMIPAFLTSHHILDQSLANDTGQQAVDLAYEENAPAEHHLSDFVLREKLHNAIEHNKMDVFLQPIVSLPQRKTLYYELFGRLRAKAGVYVPASEYMRLAREDQVINNLDTLLLSNCIQILHHHKKSYDHDVAYFLNIKPFTLRNHLFMGNLLPLLSKHRYIAQSLVFEMHYTDLLMLSPGEQKILSGLTQIGCRVSVDNIGGIPTDLKYLKARHVAFVKVEADKILRQGKTETGFSNILTKKHNLDVNGIEMIVEKVETEQQIISLLDYDIKYGQGFLFGRPDFRGVYNAGSARRA